MSVGWTKKDLRTKTELDRKEPKIVSYICAFLACIYLVKWEIFWPETQHNPHCEIEPTLRGRPCEVAVKRN